MKKHIHFIVLQLLPVHNIMQIMQIIRDTAHLHLHQLPWKDHGIGIGGKSGAQDVISPFRTNHTDFRPEMIPRNGFQPAGGSHCILDFRHDLRPVEIAVHGIVPPCGMMGQRHSDKFPVYGLPVRQIKRRPQPHIPDLTLRRLRPRTEVHFIQPHFSMICKGSIRLCADRISHLPERIP